MKSITKQIRARLPLQTATLRGFSGGLNVIDDPLNMDFKFSTVMRNVYADNDGKVSVRYGYKLFAQCAAFFTSPAYIVNIEFFNNSIVVVGSNGEILRVTGTGTVSRIFDSAIAALLPDAPSAWGPTTFASFAVFGGELIVCNGSDKPLSITSDFQVEYLQDNATNTNINVPICRYVVAVGRYLVMAGDPLNPKRVHISQRGAAGTWFGDPPPNDATFVDVNGLSDATAIRGLLPFRDKVLVLFLEGTVVGTLGIYTGESHEPDFGDVIRDHGSFSHRAAIAVGDDGLLADLQGVPSIKRTILSSSFKPERMSELIDPEITAAYDALSVEELEDRVFRVYDSREGQYMLFVPNANTVEDTTETKAFVFNYKPSLRQNNWCVFGGWNFTCGCRSIGRSVFFGDKDGNIWLYGSRDNPIYADAVDTISATPNPEGNEIEFDWEMPWLDLGDRARNKESKYISFDTRGEGEFTCRMTVDEQPSFSLSTEFSGGSQGGYGNGPQPFGGGRNTSYKKLYAWPCKFQIARLRFTGSVRDRLAFISITMRYKRLGIRI